MAIAMRLFATIQHVFKGLSQKSGNHRDNLSQESREGEFAKGALRCPNLSQIAHQIFAKMAGLSIRTSEEGRKIVANLS